MVRAAGHRRLARTTPVLKSMLDQTSRFAVTVVTAPPPAGDFSTFQPDFARYRAIVLNYDAPDERWPAALKASFDAYVSGGGGVVAVHAANNAFPGWAAYNQMLGVGGWRGRTEKAGPHWFVRDGALVSDSSPGNAGSHGKRLPFLVTVRTRPSDREGDGRDMDARRRRTPPTCAGRGRT